MHDDWNGMECDGVANGGVKADINSDCEKEIHAQFLEEIRGEVTVEDAF